MKDLFDVDDKQTKEDEIVHISKILMTSLHLKEDFVLTRGFLKNICEKVMERAEKLGKNKIILLKATKKDAEILKEYIDSSTILIKVNGERVIYDKDFINYIQSEVNNQWLLDVTLDRIEKFGDREELKNKPLSLIVNQDEFDKLSKEQEEELFKKYNIAICTYRMNDILNVDTKRLSKYNNMEIYYKDADFPENGPEDIEEIKNQIRAIIHNVKDTDSELERFTKIYTKLMENITYDYSLNEIVKKQDSIEKFTEEEYNMLVRSQNLTGLLTGSTICAGYSRILQCLLNNVGIECKYISGSTSKQRDENHAWNQVKIDGKWYNVDLTWDRDNFENYILIENCLVSDEEFDDHNPMTGEYEECKDTYDRKMLENSVINNLSPLKKAEFMMLQNEKEDSKEEAKTDETELKPWDLRNYNQKETISQSINTNKTIDKDKEEEER